MTKASAVKTTDRDNGSYGSPDERSAPRANLNGIRLAASIGEPLTQADILACHAQFGRLNWHMVKKAMGPNWPPEWEALGPGEAIFEPDEDRRP